MRKSDVFLVFMAFNLMAFLSLIYVRPLLVNDVFTQGEEARQALVKELELTDLLLFPEARYTRHLSQADLHSAFQDHPMSQEHFPAGSLTQPPEQLLNAPLWKAGPGRP